MIVPGGGAPRTMGPTGPAAPPSPNLGAQAESLSKVQQAVQILTLQLPNFPVGSEEQKTVMDAIQKLSKIAPASQAPQGVEMSTIRQLEEDAMRTGMLRRLMANQNSAGPNGGAPAPAGPPGTLPGML